jgi:hypothetical protein
MPALYTHTTRASGLTLTANIYNSDHQNHIDNGVPLQFDDYSVNVAQMKVVTDPFPGAVESLATTLAGELERIRFLIKQITGKAEWFTDPDTDLTKVSGGDSGTNIVAGRMFN